MLINGELKGAQAENIATSSLPAAGSKGRIAFDSTLNVLKYDDGSNWITISGSVDMTPAGVIQAYGGSSAPTGYLMCNGASLSTTTYAALFAAIGYTYGGSGGSFNLPDSRGIYLKGAGTTNRAAGKDASGNYYAATLGAYSTDKVQGHWHQTLKFQNTSAAAGSATGAYNTLNSSGTPGTNHEIVGWAENPSTDGTNGTPRTGHTTEPQNLGVNFIIKY